MAVITAMGSLLTVGCTTHQPVRQQLHRPPSTTCQATLISMVEPNAGDEGPITLNQALQRASVRFNTHIIVACDVVNSDNIDPAVINSAADADALLDALLVDRQVAYTRTGRFVFVFPVEGDVALASAKVDPTQIVLSTPNAADRTDAIVTVPTDDPSLLNR